MLVAILPLSELLSNTAGSWARCSAVKPCPSSSPLPAEGSGISTAHPSSSLVTDFLSPRNFSPERSALSFPVPQSLIGTSRAFSSGSTAQVMSWRDNKGHYARRARPRPCSVLAGAFEVFPKNGESFSCPIIERVSARNAKQCSVLREHSKKVLKAVAFVFF